MGLKLLESSLIMAHLCFSTHERPELGAGELSGPLTYAGPINRTGAVMQFSTLQFEQRDNIAYVTLNRPDRLNALNLPMIEDLRAAAALIEAQAELRAVLLCAAGRGFCSGADLAGEDFTRDASLTQGQIVGARLREHFNPMVEAWYRLRIPLVVAVNGIAAGAGMSLALIGDIVLAARSATFLQLFAPKLGLIPDLGSTFHLPRMLGTARAKGLTLLGDPLSAADAVNWGLIWACVDDAELAPQAELIARRLAAGPTQAFRRIKAIFNAQPADTLSEQLALEAIAQTALGETADFAEGVQAFRSKRAPKFAGN
jgi:2-(1,2-epoxy-1,2-dihydrophenyl)acetyl-CoA isomerase